MGSGSLAILGFLRIESHLILYSEGGVYKITLVKSIPEDYFEEKNNDLGDKVISELKEYFNGQRKDFNLPLIIQGTNFQRTVWEELRKINYGEIKTYSDIAKNIGKPNACRAVGNANNKNPFMIVIPCHRVVGKNKKSGGYAFGVDIRDKLLELEKLYK